MNITKAKGFREAISMCVDDLGDTRRLLFDHESHGALLHAANNLGMTGRVLSSLGEQLANHVRTEKAKKGGKAKA